MIEGAHWDYLGFHHRMHRFYHLYFRDLLRDYQLTQLAAELLLFLRATPEGATAAAFAAARHHPKSQVSQAVEQLRSGQMLYTQVNRGDRRSAFLYLTEQGAALSQKLDHDRQQALATLFGSVDPEDRRTLLRILHQVDQNIGTFL